MESKLSPIEVIEKIVKLLKEHPNAEILADIPALDNYSLDRGLSSISNVYYEPEVGIMKNENGNEIDIYFSKRDYFYDYGQRAEEEPIDFKEYIIIACH